MMTRLFLGAIALMFTGFGLWSLLDPFGMTGNLGVEIGGPNGSFEIRGVFGGVSLGAALLCAGGAIRDSMVHPALWFLVAYMGGYCLARGVSVLLGDLPESETWAFVAFEAGVLILSIFALRRRKAS